MRVHLRLYWHPHLLRYLFPGRELDFRTLAERYLLRALPRAGEGFLFDPTRLSDLEKGLSELRKLFESSLGEAPLPFTLAPEGSPGPWLRPGLLYLPREMEPALREARGGLDSLIKATRAGRLLEVTLPAATRPQTLLEVRDLFWVGESRPCFYCGLPWHASARCPALKETVPGGGLRGYLSAPLHELAKTLNQKILSRELSAPELQGLYGRFFYFLPLFLRPVFHKNFHQFSQLTPGQEVPGRGGPVQIALELLAHQEIDEAERRLLAAEGAGPEVLLALVQVALLKGEYDRALYHFEELDLEEASPLLRATALLWRARLSETQGDYASAERLYGEAQRADPSFFPAAFHRLRVSFFYGTPETRTLERLKPLLAQPLIFLYAFLEPTAILWEKALEKTLLQLLEDKQAEALARLREAEDHLHALKTILSEEERNSLEETLRTLRETIYSGVYAELERTALKAAELALELQGYAYRKIRELKDRLSEFYHRYWHLKRYWSRYPYRTEAPGFGKKLREVGERLTRIEHRLDRDPAKEFKPLLEETAQVAADLEALEKEKERLEAFWLFRRQLAFFLKFFLLGETLLFLFFFSLPDFLSSVFPEALVRYSFSLSTFLWLSVGLFFLSLLAALSRR
ncbi:hypothetical protein FVE67_04330 [Thermosulfurimonas marina]|uniref:Tetratricopeptide repeat protein n=1 Tax=Thermosulfurimonas marina TaxID=2047767 RepID=A0A6H1WSB9_9BACT|nr:hypothetical protein [Thermosulfurimonas marina]QJA06068.1 hypothetical protein FVE67_04330 [Thermosulfurimonas marina]